MTLMLELPPQLESELATQAAQLKLSLPEYAMQILAGAGIGSSKPNSGADLVAYWKEAGLIGTRSEISDPSQHARNLRKRAQHRTR